MKKQDKIAIYVGVNPESVAEMRAAINDILNSAADQQTMQKALKVLGIGCNISGTEISNCNIDQGD